MASIGSQEEQDFVQNLIRTSSVLDVAWIGAKRSKTNGDLQFKWIDDELFNYTNWEDGHPTNQSGNDCVQINSGFGFVALHSQLLGASNGKWVDVSCQKKNLFVCEKRQNWSSERLRKALLEIKNESQKEFQDLEKQFVARIDNLQKQSVARFEKLEQNPIPIDFIYVQLSSQPEPKSLWPNVEWEEITSSYSGLFFRAEGGGSSSFGSTQEGDAPRIDHIQFDCNKGEMGWNPGYQWSLPSGWSDWVNSGASWGTRCGQRFLTTSVEVRPRNQAVRIWKRTG